MLKSPLKLSRASRATVLIVFLTALLLNLLTTPVWAHPGRTDSSGCHTCKTNCTEKYGIPYGFYHQHNPVEACGGTKTTAPPPTKAPATTKVTTTQAPATTQKKATTTTTAATTTSTTGAPVTTVAAESVTTTTISPEELLVVNLEAPEEATVGQEVTLTATASGTDGEVTEYEWSFGDGTSEETSSTEVSHVFKKAGTYTIVVKAITDDGHSKTSSRAIDIKEETGLGFMGGLGMLSLLGSVGLGVTWGIKRQKNLGLLPIGLFAFFFVCLVLDGIGG